MAKNGSLYLQHRYTEENALEALQHCTTICLRLQFPAKHCELLWCTDKVPFIWIIQISTNFQLLKKQKVLFKNWPAQAGQLNNLTFFCRLTASSKLWEKMMWNPKAIWGSSYLNFNIQKITFKMRTPCI